MGYCVGNCLSWDSVSGNLTINEDPLGGLECLPGGQRIRIAGARTGVAVNAQNNGLFMTTAGELATLNTPQQKNLQSTNATVNIQAAAGLGLTFTYATAPDITFSNPSPVYNMLVICSYRFTSSLQIRNSVSNVDIDHQSIVGGVASSLGLINRGNSNGLANHADYQDVVNYTIFDYISPGASKTYGARQRWSTTGTTSPFFYSAKTVADFVGIMAPRV